MATTASATERYVRAAREAGCPADQLRNFLRAGIALQPQQLRFAAAARLCDHPDGPTEIGFGGARMGGKSHAMLAVVGADDCVRHPGLKALLLRKVGGSAREGFEALLPKTIGRLGTYRSSEGLFRFTNGSAIRLGHFQNESDVDRYLGLEYDVIAVEEATTLSLAKKTAIQSCCRSPIGSGWRARMYFSTNPGGVGHAWFKHRFIRPHRLRAERDTRFVPATVDDNAFAPAEYRRFLDSLTGWLKRAWRHGDWDIAAGQYFTTWSAVHHVVPAFGPDNPLPLNWDVWLGFDYGFTHYTYVILLARDGDGNLYAVEEHAERRWLPERHDAAIRSLLARHRVPPERLRTIAAGWDVFNKDRRGRSIAEDYAELGWTLERADADRVNGAAHLLRLLGDPEGGVTPRLFVSESCPRLVECLPALEHDPHRPEDVRKVDCDDEGHGGDDPYDALRYAAMVDATPGLVVGASPAAGYRG